MVDTLTMLTEILLVFFSTSKGISGKIYLLNQNLFLPDCFQFMAQ